MRKRTVSREIALQALYQLEIRGDEIMSEIDSFCRNQSSEEEIWKFALMLVKGCFKNIEEIDRKIVSVSENWSMHRMPVVDKNILRLACYELFFLEDIPPKVTINEAIDLAKKFSTEKSGLFVNGVLDKVYSAYLSENKNDSQQGTPDLCGHRNGEAAKRIYTGTGADLHIHTEFSDGTFTPEQVVEEAVKQGLRTIAVTDHDNIDALEATREICDQKGIQFIPAVELSSFYDPVDIHILGYYIDIKSIALREKLAELRHERIERIKKISAKLHKLKIDIDPQEVLDVAGKGVAGRVHVADVLVRKGYCSTMQECFNSYLADYGPAHVPKVSLSLEGAIELVISAGGVPVFSHPGLTKRDDLIPKMIGYGLQGIEAFYPSHHPDVVKRYIRLAQKHDLVITGGSDCHGDRKPATTLGCITIEDCLVEKIAERCNSMVGLFS
ncbi:MAG: transcription antitermination factor NusB [Candidatus Scalindua sp.]|nr:transcription antitermination factor NusB [Candidatus Scalindua sp.]